MGTEWQRVTGMLCAGWLLGCGGTTLPAPPEEVAGLPLTPPEARTIDVRGRVAVFPPAVGWYAGQGLPVPSVAGLGVRLVEPLHDVLGDPRATLGEVRLEDAATFGFTAVSTAALVLGLGAAIANGEGPPGFSPTTTLLFDTAREGRLPWKDLDEVEAWSLPAPWLDRLEERVGSAALAAWAPGATSLAEAGFVLGRVVDAAGLPLAGARVVVTPEALAVGLTYPAAGLAGPAGASTGAEGLFLLVHDGGDMRTFTLTVEGRDDVPPHRGMLARGSGLLLRIHPSP